MKLRFLPLLIITILLTACVPAVVTPAVEDVQTAIAQTEAAQPEASPTRTATKIPTASPTAEKTPTATKASAVPATINVVSQNLRSGPSTFFSIENTYDQGVSVSATARTLDNNWVKVSVRDEDDDGDIKNGWMAVEFLSAEKSFIDLPVETYPEEQFIQGTVEDRDGNPIPGITIAAILRQGTFEQRADTVSNDNGEFIIYIPPDLTGTLDVQVVGIDCTSPIVDALCNLTEYFKVEGRAFVPIPQEEEIMFVYQKADIFLDGTVEDEEGEGVAAIIVVGLRDDGAESSVRTNNEGKFSLPVAEGVWDVYTITLDPREEGEAFNIEITDSTPTIITLSPPE